MKMLNSFYTFTQEQLQTIAERLQQKMKEDDISINKLYKESGVTRPTITDMLKGHYASDGSTEREFRNHEPETYSKICEGLQKCGSDCTMKYLLGEIEHSTPDLQYICDYTGLSEKAVRRLHRAANADRMPISIHIDGNGNGKEFSYSLFADTISKIILNQEFIDTVLSIMPADYDKAIIMESLHRGLSPAANREKYHDLVLSNIETGMRFAKTQKLIELIESMDLGPAKLINDNLKK